MSPEETRTYLRNLAIVAHADRVMADEETSVIDRILGKRPGGEELWETVLAEAQSGARIDLRPIVRLSDRVRCVEDMLEISLCDGKMDNDEKKVLFDAARNAGITQQQALEMLKEAKGRCTSS